MYFCMLQHSFNNENAKKENELFADHMVIIGGQLSLDELFIGNYGKWIYSNTYSQM